MAYVWHNNKQKKTRRTFHDYTEAKSWRRNELRRLYAARKAKDSTINGRLDTAYSLLRKTTQQVDGCLSGLSRRRQADVRTILDRLYEVEDEMLVLLAVEHPNI